jgi:hypothetical protein
MRQLLIIAALLLICAGSIFALTGFGESNIFEIDTQTLPVELSSFNATLTSQNKVQLNWVTQSETNLNGFYVYRGSSEELKAAIIVSNQIQPTNTSSQQSYSYTDMEIYTSGQYYYWLQSMEMDGSSSYHGPITIMVNLDGDVSTPDIPLTSGLKVVFPNPFNPSTTISYELQSPSEVEISIYNTRGQVVRTMSRSHKSAGSFSWVFDGRDVSGNALSSGIYRVVMSAGKEISTQKIVLMK